MDVIFNMNKIKHVQLKKLFNDYVDLSHPTDFSRGVNLYINIESILRQITQKDFEKIGKVTEFSDYSKIYFSNILNLLAHYRMFFNRNSIPHNIYIYFAYPLPGDYINRSYLPTYRLSLDVDGKNTGTRLMRKIIRDNMDALETIFEYIQDASLLYSNIVEPSVIPLLIQPDNDYENIIVSNDDYDYGYIKYDFHILRPRRGILVNKTNIIDILKQDGRVVNNKTVDYRYISIIIAMLGNQYRDIPKIPNIGISKIIDMIREGESKGLLLPTINSVSVISRSMVNHSESFTTNYNVTDLDTQLRRAPEYVRLELRDKLSRNLYAVEDFKAINSKYFDEYPILINDIQPYLKKKGKRVKKNIFWE